MKEIFHYETKTMEDFVQVRRKSKHGRGLRGLVLAPNVPAYRSRQQYFDHLIISTALRISQKWIQVKSVEFCTEDVPPSDPSATDYEILNGNDVVLGRFFDEDLHNLLPARIVLYRLPIQARAKNKTELKQIVENVICQQVAYMLNIDIDEIL